MASCALRRWAIWSARPSLPGRRTRRSAARGRPTSSRCARWWRSCPSAAKSGPTTGEARRRGRAGHPGRPGRHAVQTPTRSGLSDLTSGPDGALRFTETSAEGSAGGSRWPRVTLSVVRRETSRLCHGTLRIGCGRCVRSGRNSFMKRLATTGVIVGALRVPVAGLTHADNPVDTGAAQPELPAFLRQQWAVDPSGVQHRGLQPRDNRIRGRPTAERDEPQERLAVRRGLLPGGLILAGRDDPPVAPPRVRL